MPAASLAVAASLMEHGMRWLGLEQPMWLTVIAFNERAQRFYRRFGFEVDPGTPMTHVVPHVIMRRPVGLPRIAKQFGGVVTK